SEAPTHRVADDEIDANATAQPAARKRQRQVEHAGRPSPDRRVASDAGREIAALEVPRTEAGRRMMEKEPVRARRVMQVVRDDRRLPAQVPEEQGQEDRS